MRLFFLFMVVATLVATYVLINNQKTKNPIEQAVAYWNDGTDLFYQQVLKSNGEWVENTGTAIFDNQPVQSISKIETESILVQSKSSQSQVLGLHSAADGSEK